MSSVLKKLSIILLAVAGFSGILYAQKNQRSFYGEESFRQPIQIPVEVSEKLKRDWQSRGCSGSNEQFSTRWFEATRINLNGDKFPDLLIKAKDPNHCFNGNAISFWVFANTGGKFNQAFYAYTLSFEVTNIRSKNYFNLWTSRCTAGICFNRSFTFNGQEYTQTREWEEPVRPGK